MTWGTRTLAEHVSFETFVNCYLRELGAGTWHTSQHWAQECDRGWTKQGPFVLDVELPRQSVRLAFDVSYRSVVGPHRIRAARTLRQGEPGWREAEPFLVLSLLIRELSLSRRDSATEDARAQELELLCRLGQSQQLIARYVDARRDDIRLSGDRFIDSEQSMLYGHWSHPTPKSRQGMTDWQHASYAPELRGEFQLRGFAVHRSLVKQRSALGTSAEELIRATLEEPASAGAAHALGADEVLIPVHPLQVDWLLHQKHVQRWLAAGTLRELGAVGPSFTATSSVRTVYNLHSDWMFKLSIPVKITNSLRFNQRHEVLSGVIMAALLEELGVARRYTGFRIIPDPAYITVEAPGQRESGFEVILRTNPFRPGRDTGVHCIAAIVQEPLPHRPSRLRALVEGLALTEGRSVEKVCLEWFARYWECAIEPIIRLYDDCGVALEAHQQNSLLDLSGGYPRRYFYRDNQGYYVSDARRQQLERLAPELSQVPELFYPDELIRERLAYYLISNQLFSVVHRFGGDGLLGEQDLLSVIVARLTVLHERLRGPGRPFVRQLLDEPRLPYKANLLTRLHDVDELTAELERAVYTTIENPLRRARSRAAEESREVA